MKLKEFEDILKRGNYEEIKPYLRTEVRNKANLHTKVYYQEIIGDIVRVVVAHTMLDDGREVTGLLTPVTINVLGVTPATLLCDAKDNTPCNFKVNTLNSIVKNITQDIDTQPDGYPLESIDTLIQSDNLLESTLVVNIDTNTRVSILQFPKLLRSIYSKIGDYYIIPSSVYEVMIIPSNKVEDIDSMNELIRTVNTTVVSDNDALSNRLLKYNALGLSEC